MANGQINVVARDPKSARDFAQRRDEEDRQARLGEREIRFVGADLTKGTGIRAHDLRIEVTDGLGTANVFSRIGQVTVAITGGSAPGKAISAQPSKFSRRVRVEGTKRVTVYEALTTLTVTGTGTAVLGLVDSGGTGLVVADTLTVTFT